MLLEVGAALICWLLELTLEQAEFVLLLGYLLELNVVDGDFRLLITNHVALFGRTVETYVDIIVHKMRATAWRLFVQLLVVLLDLQLQVSDAIL